MAIVNTTTSAALLAGDTTLPITSTTGFLVGNLLRMDSELSYVVAVPSATSVVVRMRGAEGTVAASHQALTNVACGLPSDFPSLGTGAVSQLPLWDQDILTIGVNTAIIAVPNRDTTFLITKATALATTTLAAPSTAANGRRITF